MDATRPTRGDVLVRLGSAVVAAAGVAVLVGWTIGSPVLMGVIPGLVPMNPATAVCFILSATALWSALTPAPAPGLRRMATAGVLVVASIGVLRLGGYLLGTDVGVDQVLFRAALHTVPHGPNRMAPNTAFCFLLTALATRFLDVETARGVRPAQHLALVVAGVSLVTVTGYAYGHENLARVGRYLPMALNTGLCFLCLAIGLLALRPASGFVRTFTSPGASAATARRLLLATTGIPWLLGWTILQGQHARLYESELAMAIVAVATIVLLVTVVGRQAHALGVAETERQRSEAAVRAARDAAEAANKELEAFSYSVSHDLRAPLRAIDGFARILVEDHAGKLDADAGRVLGVICDNARSMGRLIDDLLKFSRLGRAEPTRLQIDVAALAETIVSELRRGAPDRAVAVHVAPMPPVIGDPSMVRQMLANLIGNAWKFTAGRADARIDVGCVRRDGEVVYFVRDNGAGFDMQYVDKLFGVFQRLHRAEEFEGTGVGLAIVQRVVARHGGRVWAEGAVGQGATFHFTLPAEEGKGDAADGSGDPAGGGQPGGRGAGAARAPQAEPREQAPPRA